MPTNSDKARNLANQTWEVLSESAIPDHAYGLAFGAVFSYLAQGAPQQAETGDADQRLRHLGAASDGASEGLPAIADALGIDEGTVAYLFDIDGKDLDLTIRREQLPKDRLTAMREVALLVVAGRQAAGLDPDRTDSKHVRAQGAELNVMAKNSFRDEMGNLGPFVTSKPLGQYGRALKMTKGGYDETAKIVKRIADSAGSQD